MPATLSESIQPIASFNHSGLDIASFPQDRRPGAQDGLPLTKAAVAELSMADIQSMCCEQLAAVVQAAEIPFLQDTVNRHLAYYDRNTLEQLAFLARRTVRNQGY